MRGQPFGLALMSQTLEHLYDPLLSLVNLRHKLEPGGLLFTSTPTVNRPHMVPFHFRHYSPMGLAALLSQAGFEILEAGQWGNAHYLDALFELVGMEWPSYTKGHVTALGADTLDPSTRVENTRELPVQVWALARRPVDDGDATAEGSERAPRYKRSEVDPCHYPHPTNRRGKQLEGLSPLALAATTKTTTKVWR